MQVCDTCWLRFMYKVGVPTRSSAGLPEICCFVIFLVKEIRPHDRDAGTARNLWDLGMNLNDAEVFTESLLLLRRDILIAEKNDASFRDQ